MINSTFWKHVSSKIIQYKLLILVLLSLTTGLAIPGISRLNITVDIEDFFLEDDPILENQNKFDELFATKNYVGVLVESTNVFSASTLNLIREASNALEARVPLAEGAISIAGFSFDEAPNIALQFKDHKIVSEDAAIEAYKDYLSNDESLSGVFFSKDHTEAWILLPLKPFPPEQEWSGEESAFFTVGKETYNAVQSISTGDTKFTATGFSVYAHRKKTEMLADLIIILIIGAALACILSIIVFRDLLEVLATLLVIGLSVVYVLGTQGWLGASIDSAFISVPVLLTMGVGIGYAVHIAAFFRQAYLQHGNRVEAITSAVSKCATPIFFTAFTTTAALSSFMFVNIKPIQWVGYSSALCIVMVYILSMVCFPIIVSFGKSKRITKAQQSSKVAAIRTQEPAIHPLLNLFASWVEKYRYSILLLFLALSGLGIYGILHVQVDLDAKKMTGTKLAHMKDIIQIGDSQIASNEILELVLSLDEQSMKKLENITRIAELEEQIAELSLVKHTNSLAKQIQTINYISHAKLAAFDALPKTQHELDSLFEFIYEQESEVVETWSNPSLSTTRISIALRDFSSKTIEAHIYAIEDLVQSMFPEDTDFFFSGATFQMAMMNQYITKGLVRSLFTALITITIIMMLIFKSIPIGLVAMVPNVFPVIVAGGIMGLLQVPLEFVTMTVAPLILGLSVDDTIHLIWHLREDLSKNSNFLPSLRHTFSIVGKAITQTTVILCLAFLVFAFSKVNNIVYMGIIICAGLFAAYASDIFVSPILIKKILRAT